MNVASVGPASTIAPAADGRDGGLPKTGHQTEWTDPEGDDWFGSIYRELTQEPASTAIDKHALELEQWFG